MLYLNITKKNSHVESEIQSLIQLNTDKTILCGHRRLFIQTTFSPAIRNTEAFNETDFMYAAHIHVYVHEVVQQVLKFIEE